MSITESFVIAEYSSLREEIQNKIKLLDKIDLSGVFGLPAVFAITTYTSFFEFLFLVPLIIITIVLIYLNTLLAIFRLGKYIREEIEVKIANHIGWEIWLDNYRNTRKWTIERIRNSVFIFLIIIYYIGSIYFLYHNILIEKNLTFCICVIAFYVITAVLVVLLVKKKFPIGVKKTLIV